MKRRILVLDNDPDIHRFFINHLDANLYDIVSVFDTKSAISWLKLRCVDLIVCEVALPDINGMEFIRILNNFKQRNKIVFFSFCQLNVDQYQFKQLSICGFYNKSLLSLLNFSKIFNKIFKYSV